MEATLIGRWVVDVLFLEAVRLKLPGRGVFELDIDCSKGGGSFRRPIFEACPRMEDADDAMLCCEFMRDGPGRGTFTQSGSSVSANGFAGLSGFGNASGAGGCTVDRAGTPLSSHHFLRSELAGGRPGSMAS